MAQPPEDIEARIPIVEETVRLERREVASGRVRVRTRTAVESELVGAELEHVTVEVRRVPVDREVEAAPPVRTEGDVTIIPVVEEILVVEKRLILKEEIHLVRHREQEKVELPVERRRQVVDVDREKND